MGRSLSVIQMHVKKPNIRKAPNPWQVLSDLPDGGDDLLDVIESALASLADDALVDEEKRKYVHVMDVQKAPGHPRVLVASVEVGNYGERGRTRDINTHLSTYEHDTNEAPVLDARVLFVVPDKARMALMYSERVHPFSATAAIVKSVRSHWIDQAYAKTWNLYAESVVNVDAWLASAQINKIEAVSYGHKSDYEGLSNTGKRLGDLTMTLAPPKGDGHLPKRLWQLLRDNPAERAKILGISGLDDELDEVSLTVEGSNGQVKTFVIDKQKAPSIRLPLTDLEADTSSPNHLVSRCIAESPEIFRNVGHEWHAV